MTTRIALIDQSRVRIGAEPLGLETAPGADTDIAIHDSVVEDITSRHPWNHSRFIRQLARKAAAPEAHWAYAYELPADMLGSPRAVFERSDARIPTTAYELFGNGELRTNAEQIWIAFDKLVAPALWPGYFRELIRLALMAEMALSVREDRALRDRLREDLYGPPSLMGMGGQLGLAMAQNDMAKPSAVVAEGDNPLVDVRV